MHKMSKLEIIFQSAKLILGLVVLLMLIKMVNGNITVCQVLKPAL
jgi:hypothetical protein